MQGYICLKGLISSIIIIVNNIFMIDSSFNLNVPIIVLLIGLLISGDLLSTHSKYRNKFLMLALNISIILLLIYFAVIVGFKFSELLA